MPCARALSTEFPPLFHSRFSLPANTPSTGYPPLPSSVTLLLEAAEIESGKEVQPLARNHQTMDVMG